MKNTVAIKLNRDFHRLYNKGRSAVSSSMVLYVRENRFPNNRIGLTVSTKIGKAVCRNKIRRRFREIYKLNEEQLVSGIDIVIVARNKSRYADFWELEEDFRRLCKKLGITKQV